VSNREPSVEFMSLGERLEEERVSWLKVAEERDKRRKTKIIKLNNVIGARGNHGRYCDKTTIFREQFVKPIFRLWEDYTNIVG
jgi:hypothetical protein